MAARDDRARWYFSLRSPYSWLAHHALERTFPDVADQIEWIPFWEPDALTQKLLDDRGVTLPIVPMSRAKHFYILRDVSRLARVGGLAMTWPIDRDPVWEVAHLGYLVADAGGQGRQYVDAVYRARWEFGRNISDREVIAQVAGELGLDPDCVANASDDPQVRTQGVEALIRSYDDGLFGAPFFVKGYDRFFGVDRLRPFVEMLRGQDPAPGTAGSWLDDVHELSQPAPLGTDMGHAGGCG